VVFGGASLGCDLTSSASDLRRGFLARRGGTGVLCPLVLGFDGMCVSLSSLVRRSFGIVSVAVGALKFLVCGVWAYGVLPSGVSYSRSLVRWVYCVMLSRAGRVGAPNDSQEGRRVFRV